jgi:hypothetical protein
LVVWEVHWQLNSSLKRLCVFFPYKNLKLGVCALQIFLTLEERLKKKSEIFGYFYLILNIFFFIVFRILKIENEKDKRLQRNRLLPNDPRFWSTGRNSSDAAIPGWNFDMSRLIPIQHLRGSLDKQEVVWDWIGQTRWVNNVCSSLFWVFSAKCFLYSKIIHIVRIIGI